MFYPGFHPSPFGMNHFTTPLWGSSPHFPSAFPSWSTPPLPSYNPFIAPPRAAHSFGFPPAPPFSTASAFTVPSSPAPVPVPAPVVPPQPKPECGVKAGRSAAEAMTIFTDPTLISPYGRAVVYTAELAGVPYKICPIDLAKGEQMSDAYKAITPTQKIPALRDGDVYLFESAAITRYIAHKYAPSLDGADGDAAHFGVTQSVIEYVRGNILAASMRIFHEAVVAPKFLGIPTNVDRLNSAKDDLARGLAFADEYFFMQDPRFCIGTHVTLADVFLAIAIKQLDLATDEFDFSGYRRVFDAVQAQAETHAFACAHRIYNDGVSSLLRAAEGEAVGPDAGVADAVAADELPTAE